MSQSNNSLQPLPKCLCSEQRVSQLDVANERSPQNQNIRITSKTFNLGS